VSVAPGANVATTGTEVDATGGASGAVDADDAGVGVRVVGIGGTVDEEDVDGATVGALDEVDDGTVEGVVGAVDGDVDGDGATVTVVGGYLQCFHVGSVGV
jgi:hypothetical protein